MHFSFLPCVLYVSPISYSLIWCLVNAVFSSFLQFPSS
jgi:hypothetical protein